MPSSKRPKLFSAAIEKLKLSGFQVGDPIPFKTYAVEQGHPKASTAANISIDSFASLAEELRESNNMVFRLGSPKGQRETNFALANFGKVQDFFLVDASLFSDCRVSTFLPSASIRSLFAHQLLPKLTETSLVNLAVASGLIKEALEIESESEQLVPATGRSNFTFDVKPKDEDSRKWVHQNGQVEIDGLFVGRRDGQECIFVIEAKTSDNLDSLAKHKVVYPVLAVSSQIPRNMPIVPIYIRCIRKSEKEIWFHIAELEFEDPREKLAGVDSLKLKRAKVLALYGF